MGSGDETLNSAVLGVAATLFAMLAWLPIGLVRVGDSSSEFSLRSLGGIGYVVIALALVLTAVALVQLWRGPGESKVAAWGFGVLAAVTMLSIVVIEGIGKLVPRSLLPATLRRFVFNLGVTATPWLAVMAAAVAAIAAAGRTRDVLAAFQRDIFESTGMHVLRMSGLAAAVAGIVVLALSRNHPIAVVSYPGGEVKVETWALPWIGPGSLFVVMGLAVSVAGVASGRATGVFGTVGAVISWTAAFTTGLMVATSGLMVDTGALDWVIRQLQESEVADRLGVSEAVSITSNSGPVSSYVGACLAAAGFSASLARRPS